MPKWNLIFLKMGMGDLSKGCKLCINVICNIKIYWLLNSNAIKTMNQSSMNKNLRYHIVQEFEKMLS